MILTAAERNAFLLWLRQEARSDKMLIDQMQKLASPGMEALIKRRKTELAAEMVLIEKLSSGDND